VKIYEILPAGVAVAKSIHYHDSPEHDILVWLNRRGGRCTDDQVIARLGDNRGEAMAVLSNLQKAKVVARLD
jgi:hypothetical protein